MLHNEFKTTCTWIMKKLNGIHRTVGQRHSRKLSTDKINLNSKNIQEKRSKNRRLSKDEISVKKKNKSTRNKLTKASKGATFYPYTCGCKLV